jgi:Zn-dependent peptidase ImmA (M78 family)
MPDPIEVPWLEEGQIQARAEAFLAEQQCSDVFPVPVELIVERQGIDIFPLVGLRQNYDIDGFTSADRKMIYVDEWSSKWLENRYRFTLAHELGHVILHGDLLDSHSSSVKSLEQWLHLRQSIDEASWRRFEWQANYFAGHLLVPSKALGQQYSRVLPGTRQRVEEALRQGFRKSAVIGPAWDSLVEEIASYFQVSEPVVRIRLAKEEFSPASL